MSSLRQILSAPRPTKARTAAALPGERRAGRERRGSERRRQPHPFESRETRLRFAAQAAGFGTYDLDCHTGDSAWSPELAAIVGLPPERCLLSVEEIEAMIHPEDRQRVAEKLRASLDPQGSGEFEDEHRLLRPDGSLVWVRTRGRTFFVGEERRPIAATGLVMDITASRAAAKQLAESRAELENMVEAAIDAVVTIDSEQRIIRFNPSAARMFGCPAEEALGSGVERFMPERYRASHADKVRSFAEGEAPARALDSPRRFTGLRADGREFPFEASITKVDGDGKARMTTFMRDITDRVQAQEALRRSKEDLELAVRGGNIGIWHWDLESGEAQLSEPCRQLFGIAPGARTTYENILAVIHPDDRPAVQAALRRTVEQGVEYKIEKRFVWPDGSVHWLECTGRGIWDGKGARPAGVRGISLDVTERKRQEEALQHSKADLEARVAERTAALTRANEALERSNLELQQFAFIAAHDLQTPLRSIGGFAQLLHVEYGGRIDPQADLWLKQLVRSAERMHELIRDVLAYSRVESRGNAFQAIDFNLLFDDVAETLEFPVRESGARVTRGDLPTVMGDRIQLAQVLQNLIDNAIKYRGGEPPRIHVSAAKTGEEWIFSVRDNGIGMAGKHLESIFDIFRRLHTDREYPGTGIGLAICRRVIHRHGGRIWAESAPGAGSTFHFTLPEREASADAPTR